MEHERKQLVSAIDAVEYLLEYISIHATVELQKQFMTFYDAFNKWKIQREGAISNSKQSVPKLIEDYFEKKW